MPSWQRIQSILVPSVSSVTKKGNITSLLTSQDGYHKPDQRRVAHIKHRSCQSSKAHTRRPEDQRVDKHIPSGHSCSRKCPPLPPVILSAKEEVREKHRRRCGCHNHQSVADEQKSKHVIDLVGPQRRHDKVELHENRPERQNARQEKRRNGTKASCHRGDLTGDLVGLGRSFNSLSKSVEALNDTSDRLPVV